LEDWTYSNTASRPTRPKPDSRYLPKPSCNDAMARRIPGKNEREPMYKIEAIIRPHRLESVRDALQDADIVGMTATDARGEGKQRATTHTFRGSQYSHGLEPRTRIEVVVLDAQLDPAVKAIQEAATTGEVGDGKIFVTKLHDVIRIRTNEHGEEALS